MKTEIKILIGKKSTRTAFGKIGSCKGMYSGGFNNYRYGVKGLFSIGYYQGWGSFKDSTNAFN